MSPPWISFMAIARFLGVPTLSFNDFFAAMRP